MTNPLSFLFGAGASAPFGIPMMRQFHSDFRRHIEISRPHCTDFLREIDSSAGENADLETLLGTLEELIQIEAGMKLLGGPTPEQQQKVGLAREIRGYLDAFLIETCERFDGKVVGAKLREFVQLSKVAPIWVFTTNYDRIIEVACSENKVNYSDGFALGVSRPIAEWTDLFDTPVRLVKLHGSVNWYEEEPGSAIKRLESGYSLPSYEFRLVREDQRLRPLMIVPTQEKAALRRPYAQLGIRFTDVLRDTHLLVVIGNSLRDVHIRNFIQTRMSTLNVLLINPAAVSQKSLLSDTGRIHTIDCGFEEFLAVGIGLLSELAAELKDKEFPAPDLVQERVATLASQANTALQSAAREQLPSNVAALVDESVNGNVAVRSRAIRQLSDHEYPRVIKHLRSLVLSEEDPVIKISAIDALWELQRIDAVDVIGRALIDDKNEDVRIEAALALQGAGQAPAAKSFLAQASTDERLTAALREIIDSFES